MTSSSSKLHILFVEDEPDLQKVIQLALKNDDTIIFEVVSSAEKAIEYLKDNTVDAIVSDHYLPGMTGVELLKSLKDSNPNIIRFLLTGSVENEVFEMAEQDAMPVKIFEKPLILEDIINEIKEITNG
ncbi:MAG: response regulator [Candidatus Kariarchaeaceae archaeon]|jgi:CheY-like chemotaxis protein